MSQLKISVLMPVYNGTAFLADTLRAVFGQDYDNFEIIFSDDCSTDDVAAVLRHFPDKRLRYFRNKANVGYGRNLELCRQRASTDADIVFLMAQDDLLAGNVFKRLNTIFIEHPDVGVVIRPFYLFADDFQTPVRDFPPLDRQHDRVISLQDGQTILSALFGTVVQLSGLAFRRSLMQIPFHSDTMPAHTYPFFHILRTHQAYFMKDYTVAVRRYSSQTRRVAKIYEVSPTQSWVTMIMTVFPESEFAVIRKQCLKLVSQNFVGLVQLKNFSTWPILFREYWIMVKNYPFNLLYPVFWAFVIGTLFVPRRVLLPLADWYQVRVAAQLLKTKGIRFTPVSYVSA